MAPRSQDEIVEAVLAVLAKLPADRRADRAEVVNQIAMLRDFARAPREPSAARRKERLGDYLKALTKAKTKAAPLPRWHNEYDEHNEFVVQLQIEIKRIKQHYAATYVPHGHRPQDWMAAAAVQAATELLMPEAYRHAGRENRPPLTEGGAWHQVAMLLYQAATGEPEHGAVWLYMRKIKSKKGLPRLMLWLS